MESQREQDQDGQVSEVSGLKAQPDDESSLEQPGDPIEPGDSVAGDPDGESGGPDEGPTGPDAPTNAPRQDRYPDKDDVETTG